jgi:hypothetical protein
VSNQPRYRPIERTLETRVGLTQAQHHHLLRLLGLPPGRFKPWATHFVFTLSAAGEPSSDRALAYLRAQRRDPDDLDTTGGCRAVTALAGIKRRSRPARSSRRLAHGQR